MPHQILNSTLRGAEFDDKNNFYSIFSMALSNRVDRMLFDEFSASRSSIKTVRAISVILLLFVVYFYTLALTGASGDEAAPFVATLVLQFTLRLPVHWFLLLINYRQNKEIVSPFIKRVVPWIPFLQNSTTIVSPIILGLNLVARMWNPHCSDLTQMHMYHCNSEYSSRALPQEHLLMLMLLPVVYSVVFKGIKFEFICLSWLIINFFIALCIGLYGATQSIPMLVLYIPISFIIMYENERQNLILFFVVKKQKELLEENQQLAEETQTELRHMIANVAHDLKTPLSAFMSGIETMSNQIDHVVNQQNQRQQEIALKTSSGESISSIMVYDSAKDVANIKENIDNLNNVNSFMIMTINRCIDYTKASKGMKLEARLETIHLLDIITLPINCMRDMQTRILIDLLPIHESVCSHIITDKQWLQENLFCLISNAVKYSSGGSVTVNITLTTADKAQVASDLHRRLTPQQIEREAQQKERQQQDQQQQQQQRHNSIEEAAADEENHSSNILRRSSFLFLDRWRSVKMATRASINSLITRGSINSYQQDSGLRESDGNNNSWDAAVYGAMEQGGQSSSNCGGGGGGEGEDCGSAGGFVNHNNNSNNNSSISPSKDSPNRDSPAAKDKDRDKQSDLDIDKSEWSVGTILRTKPSNNPSTRSNITRSSLLSRTSLRSSQTFKKSKVAVAPSPSKRSDGSKVVTTANGALINKNSTFDSELLVLIEVEDTGIGLSDETMATLFTPFKQAQRRAGGTGLGLYSLAKRVEALGGFYGVQKRKDGNEGSLFWFAVPYTPDLTMQGSPHGTGDGVDDRSGHGPTVFQKSAKSSPHNSNSNSNNGSSNPTIVSPTSTSNGTSAKTALVIDTTSTSERLLPRDRDVSSIRIPIGINSSGNHNNSSSSSSSSSGNANANANTKNKSNTPMSGTSVATVTASASAVATAVSSLPLTTCGACSDLDILLVDDSLTILKMTTQMLKKQGHNVTQAENGAHALQALNQRRNADPPLKPFDIVLMDLNMPVMDGLEAASRLRATESTLSTEGNKIHQFVVGFSANSDTVTMKEAFAAGVDDFICKPFALKTFYDVYQKHKHKDNTCITGITGTDTSGASGANCAVCSGNGQCRGAGGGGSGGGACTSALNTVHS